MSYKKPLAEREHALEEAYFRKQNQHLIDRMRARREAAEKGETPEEFRLGTILVATDFSTGAAHATDMAIDYAKKFGAKLVTGMSTPARARICRLRSLSRERDMACDSTAVNTFIISNWRTTAVP